MDYRIYTDDDIELATEYLCDYVEGNNRPEQMTLFKRFEKDNSKKREFTQAIVSGAYGINVPLMANFLQTQDLFFTVFMPQWLGYFDALGIEAKCTYVKLSEIGTPYMIHKFSKNPMLRPLVPFNPNVRWRDFRYTDNVDVNLMNPMNIFYNAQLTFDYHDNDKLVDALNRLFHTPNNKIDRSLSKTYITINALPAHTPERMNSITKILHKYV